jgi:hypothetical protein
VYTPEDEVVENPSVPFVDDLGNQPELPLGAPTLDLVETAGDGYTPPKDGGGHLSNGDEQPG